MTKHLLRSTFVFVILSISVTAFAAEVENWQKTDWTPVFLGIDTATGQAEVPRLMRVYAVRIDLKAEGIEFFSTPRAEEDFEFKVKETVRETVPQFLEKHQLQAAFNANFYSPFSAQTIGTPGPSILRGLAVSQGELVSKNEKGWPAFLVFKDNRAEIADVQENDLDPPAEVETAVAGNRLLVDQGAVLPQTNQDVHPRTAVGVSEDSQYVYFIVIDGRQPGYSEGASYSETAQWLVLFGAYSGLNLDGGGSTTMAVRSPEGKAKVLNRQGPTNFYRHNGNSIGVRAKSLAL